MNLSPDSYRQINAQYRKIIKRAELYLEGKDLEGNNFPMIFREEVEEISKLISIELGKCELGKDCVKSNTLKSKYQYMIDSLNEYLEKINDMY